MPTKQADIEAAATPAARPSRIRRWVRRFLLALLVVVLGMGTAAVWYLNDTYEPGTSAAVALEDKAGIDVRVSNEAIAFVPEQPRAGVVLYPGAKVEPEAYAPLARTLAERGLLAALVRSPLNFAILDADAAEDIRQEYPEIDTWILAGHSLGGVAAASCAAEHPDSYAGLALLASYPDDDLRRFKGKVVSIYGSEDGVLNRTTYAEAQSLLPDSSEELVLEGANHAGFGDYGPQTGDGTASMSPQSQQAATADAIAALTN